jgi:hypothetical protein
MLPWISLRDRILNSLATINELEFVQDMAGGNKCTNFMSKIWVTKHCTTVQGKQVRRGINS